MTRKKKKAKRSGKDWFTDLLHNIRTGRWADVWLNIWRQQTASRAKASTLGKKHTMPPKTKIMSLLFATVQRR
ncbi:MAG: hypothetical protein AAFR67_16745 [Chloroflexota bacterium]